MVRLALIVAFLFFNNAATSQLFWMTEAELRDRFAAAKISGEYVDGRTFSERYGKDNRLTYRESTQKMMWSGSWSIVNGRFCTIYDNFGTGGCFRVRQVSLNCFEFYFDTRTEEEARASTLTKPSWTARAWRTDQLSTCQDRPMV